MNRKQYRRWYFRQLRAYEKQTRGIVKRHLKNTLIQFANSSPRVDTIDSLLSKTIYKSMD